MGYLVTRVVESRSPLYRRNVALEESRLKFGSNPTGPMYPSMGMSGGPLSAPMWRTAGLGQPQQAGASVLYAQVCQQVVPENRVQQMLLLQFLHAA